MFVSLHVNSSVNKNVGGFSTYYYPKTDNDLRLAKNIQNKLAANFGVDDLGVRQANFYVIKRISMPAVLVEMCFISNEKELTLMKGQWFQKKTARLIAEGIENILHNTEAASNEKANFIDAAFVCSNSKRLQ